MKTCSRVTLASGAQASRLGSGSRQLQVSTPSLYTLADDSPIMIHNGGRDSIFFMSQGARSTASRRHSTPRGVPGKVMVGAWVVHVDASHGQLH